jgi:hypothetical protein
MEQKKIKMENSVLNDIIDQMGLKDIFKILHSIATEYKLFSISHENFSKYILFRLQSNS